MSEIFGTMCCICFEPLTAETCAVDLDGTLWDACPGKCARDAGVKLANPDEGHFPS